MHEITLAFTDKARADLRANGHEPFNWPNVSWPTLPAVGDIVALDDVDTDLRFEVVRRTFTHSVLSDVIALEIELGLPFGLESDQQD